MKIEAGWLVAEASDPTVLKIPSERTSDMLTVNGWPAGIVAHWSADPVDERGHGDTVWLANSIAKLPPPGTPGASWHLLFDRDGTVAQSVSFLKASWHVGKPGKIAGAAQKNVNRVTNGFEFENAGRLLNVAGRWYGWPYWKSAPGDASRTPNPQYGPDPRFEIPKERTKTFPQVTVETTNGLLTFPAGTFEVYTPEQERSFELVVRALVQAYQLPREAFGYGHANFVPLSFKEDPGPVWFSEVLPRVLKRVFP